MRPASANTIQLSRRADVADFFAPKELELPIIHGGILSREDTIEAAKKLKPDQTYPVRNPYMTRDIRMTGAKILERIELSHLPTTGMVIAKGKPGNGTWYIVLKEHFEPLASQPEYEQFS